VLCVPVELCCGFARDRTNGSKLEIRSLQCSLRCLCRFVASARIANLPGLADTVLDSQPVAVAPVSGSPAHEHDRLPPTIKMRTLGQLVSALCGQEFACT
jgi:hypothetical protein